MVQKMKRADEFDVRDSAGFIAKCEGCRLAAYRCPAGVWTIGYGHASGVAPGEKITQKEADELLIRDLRSHRNALVLLVKVPITQGMFTALLSLVYNIGAGRFEKLNLLKRLNQGDYRGAAADFLDINRAGGKVLRGLTLRRQAEARVFLEE